MLTHAPFSINLLTFSYFAQSYHVPPDSDGHYRIHSTEFKSEKSISFGVLGDWGGFPAPWDNTPFQVSAAKGLGQISKEKDAKFTMAIGDNFYFWGVQDIYDERWYTTYERIYTDESLQKPWYVCAGNHDWQGNVTAQIEYSKYNQRWTFPNFYYTVKYEFAENTTLTMIYLDTQMLCDQGVTEVNKQYPTPVTEQMKIDEMEWLEKELEATKNDDYVLVVGHYQVHTPSSALKCMKPVDELLRKYDVSGYINGHIHNQLHMSSVEEPKIHYLETGMGALTSVFLQYQPPYKNDAIEVEFIFQKLLGFKGAFAMATVDEHELVFEWYVSSDTWPVMQHEVRIPKRKFD